MAYSSHISSKAISSSGGIGGSSTKTPAMYGRVVSIILSFDDPRCTDASKINGVYFRRLKTATNEEDIDKLEFAPQGSATNRQLPLIGEVITLVTLPGVDTLQNPEKTQLYWKDIVNAWNHPHINASLYLVSINIGIPIPPVAGGIIAVGIGILLITCIAILVAFITAFSFLLNEFKLVNLLSKLLTTFVKLFLSFIIFRNSLDVGHCP